MGGHPKDGLGGIDSTAAPSAFCCTVLVIDDDAVIRHSLEILLESHGFQVALARNGAQGLAAFRRIEPDLVLTDIVMSVQDGIETILTMRRERPDARIIAMSGRGAVGNTDYVDIAIRLGADAAIPKPLESSKLIAAVQALVAGPHRPLPEALCSLAASAAQPPGGRDMSTEIDRTEMMPTELGSAADDIEVRRAPDHEASIVAAAKAWARALQAKQRKKNPGEDAETAELAVYDALADADALRSAELALYQAVWASGLK